MQKESKSKITRFQSAGSIFAAYTMTVCTFNASVKHCNLQVLVTIPVMFLEYSVIVRTIFPFLPVSTLAWFKKNTKGSSQDLFGSTGLVSKMKGPRLRVLQVQNVMRGFASSLGATSCG